MVDGSTYVDERYARLGLGLKGKAHADDLQRIGEEDGYGARQTATEEAAQRRFLTLVFDECSTNLLIGQEFDAGVGEDA